MQNRVEAIDSHYSRKTGHFRRGLAEAIKREFGFRPSTLAGDPVFLSQVAYDRRRLMRRTPRSGR